MIDWKFIQKAYEKLISIFRVCLYNESEIIDNKRRSDRFHDVIIGKLKYDLRSKYGDYPSFITIPHGERSLWARAFRINIAVDRGESHYWGSLMMSYVYCEDQTEYLYKHQMYLDQIRCGCWTFSAKYYDIPLSLKYNRYIFAKSFFDLQKRLGGSNNVLCVLDDILLRIV